MLAMVFPLPPLVAYKRPPNIKDKLIRAKVPDTLPARPRRIINGMKKCNKCPICPYVQVGPIIKATQNNSSTEINAEVNCQTKNIIYIIGCQKCKEQYVGETFRSLQERFSEQIQKEFSCTCALVMEATAAPRISSTISKSSISSAIRRHSAPFGNIW